jgi:sugar phosphate isomerase/epimerase
VWWAAAQDRIVKDRGGATATQSRSERMWRTGLFSGALRDWSGEDVVRAAADAGFDGVEWELDPSGHIRLGAWEDDARARGEDALRAGLEVCAVSASNAVSLLDAGNVDAVVGACKAVGAPLARLFAPPFEPDRSVDEQLSAVSESLARHARADASRDVAVIIELSEQTLVPSPELLVRVCDGLDPRAVGCVYDPANMLVEGNLEPTFALRVLGAYLRHVHVKNELFVREDGRRWEPKIVPLHEGLVDWRLVVRALADSGYDGWFVIDHLSADGTAQRVKEEYETLRRLVEEAAPADPRRTSLGR